MYLPGTGKHHPENYLHLDTSTTANKMKRQHGSQPQQESSPLQGKAISRKKITSHPQDENEQFTKQLYYDLFN